MINLIRSRSLVVDYVSSPDSGHGIRAVAFTYFNYKQQNSQNTLNVLGDITCQLLLQLPNVWGPVKELFKHHKNGATQPTVDELIRILNEVDEPDHILLAFDALDEAGSGTRDSLIQHIQEFAKLPMRIFLTSRPDVELRILKEYILPVKVSAIDADLIRYARKRLQENSSVQCMLDGHSEAIITEIVNLIVSQARGMYASSNPSHFWTRMTLFRFLVVVFNTSNVCQQTSLREMIETAKSISSDPNSVYSQTMEQICLQSPSQVKVAKRVLSWLLLAFRSLTPRELVEALTIEPNTRALDPLNKRTPSMLVKVCRGLVVVDKESDVIQLAHKTVQEYLLSCPQLDLPSMQREIFASCLTYLSFDVFRSGSSTKEKLFSRLSIYPFHAYAANYLADHLNLLAHDEAIFEQVYDFINCKPLSILYLRSLNACGFIDPTHLNNLRVPVDTSPLNIAALMGNLAIVRLMLQRQPGLLNALDPSNAPALRWAVTLGYEDVVKELLNANADTSWANFLYSESLLNCAARNGYDGIVRLLIQHEASVQNPSLKLALEIERGRELLVAVINGDDVSVQQILEKGQVNVDIRDSDGGTPLQWAAWYGNTTIVEKLLDSGADINATDQTSGRTALHEAAEHGHYKTVKYLLDKSADMEVTDDWGGLTALHRAAWFGHKDVTDLLLSYGANIDARCNGDQSALYLACCRAHVDIIRLLVSRGINTEKFKLSEIEFDQNISESQKESANKLLQTLLPSCL